MVGIIGSLALIAGAVYLLAIITDSFFIISLDQISRKLNLSDEVAGASLMAVGSRLTAHGECISRSNGK